MALTKSLIVLRNLTLVFCFIISCAAKAQAYDHPVKIGVVGLTHTHVHWILGRPDLGDIEIVGIVEPNKELAARYAKQHGYPMDIVFDTMEEMIEKCQPEAVTAFGTIYEHLKVVEICAPLGIHVMVEKPLAVSMEHAVKMEALSKKHKIHLLTNYETSWYASHDKAFEMVTNKDIGELRKLVVHDGHQGPFEIGVNKEFLDWLKDPVQNGGGALTDFGCYGANLITWFMKGEKPVSVTAVTQTFKPDLYPDVDDEATIILTYPKTQGIIQASWNWPIARKDLEIYGVSGQIFCDNSNDLRFQLSEKSPEKKLVLPQRPYPYNDPFALFSSVIRNKLILHDNDLSGLKNNMIVIEILEAAKLSAKERKSIGLAP